MKRLLVIGSTCTDVIIRLRHLPVTGEDMHPLWQRFAMGGCAYNAARIAKAAGIDMRLVTPVGTEGVYSEFVMQNLNKNGFSGPVTVPGKQNGCCYCFVEDGGERTFVSLHGIEYSFDSEYMSGLTGESFDYTYVCGLEIEESTGGELISWLETHVNSPEADINAGTLLYAPGPRGAGIDAEKTARILRLHPILHMNESEALAMSGQTSVEDAAQALFSMTGNMVIITLGERGVLWCTPDRSVHTMPAVPNEIVDTIGAGDAHCGAVLAGLCIGLSEDDCFRFANSVSSAVVGTEGASLPDGKVSALLSRYM